ncbi:Transmembrane emp24 domain-containing protein p24delta3 [Dichanthelium oligosanthes]|uniref:Transmembrane emp24 domain-containing protein p24delta3 n=1 Tax=Dichanthelium oligosanthes TaxID=888268 RepID=A0A1E5VHY3_9POAL|nr:Transmembrane emp24 domain-containing protein p24delta3 [Dichanthelium oligosanthes]
MGRGGAGAVAAALTLWWLTGCAGAVWLELSTTATKCLSEEIQSNVVVMADYSILYEEHPVRPSVSAKVTSPYGDVLHHAEKVSHGEFAFTTAESGIYLACFWADTLDRGMVVNLNLDWRIGIAAKDWDSVAKKEKIDGVALELVKLEAAARAIHGNLLYLIVKEADMRNLSEWTQVKITWLSLMSLAVCIAVSVWQAWHLKQFFRKKKLI